MSNKDIIYKNVMETPAGAISTFMFDSNIKPNRIFLSQDVLGFMGSYTRSECGYALKASEIRPVISIMGIEVEEVPYTKGLIEVGYVYRVPYRVNTEYRGEDE